MHGHGQVGGKGPGGGGPDDYGFARTVQQGELDPDGGVLLLPVLDLGLGQSGLASGAPDNSTEVLKKQVFGLGPGQGPPGCLDVGVLDGLIGSVPVQPDPQFLELTGHDVAMLEGELLALGDETVDAVILDGLLVGEVQFLLHANLNGESVHIPAGLVPHVEAVHALVADDGVLQGLVPGRAQVNGT